MCGIAGIYNFNKKAVSERETACLIKTLEHRGPDGSSILVRGNLGLAHSRLAIVGLEDGSNQPLANENRSIWLVCNGEIYNFRELKKELSGKGHKFSSNSDNEVILHLYEEYGLDFIGKLEGMFAFAIWDERSGRFILARDRLGIKPLYYSKTGGKLIFASEMKGILAHPEFKKELNADFLKFYFFHNSVPSPITPFLGVSEVLPAHLLVFNKGGPCCSIRYWRPDFTAEEMSEKEALESFSRILKNSVYRHLPPEVSWGIAASGGVDSNVLLALAASMSKKPLKIFSCSFVDDTKDKRSEVRAVKELAARYGAEHCQITLSPRGLPEKIEKIVGALDAPVCTFAIDYYLAEKAKGNVKVLFTGDGTEELFGKYWCHRLAQSMAHILDYCVFDRDRQKFFNSLLKKYCEIVPRRAFQFSAISNFREGQDSLFSAGFASLLETKEKTSDFMFKNYFGKKNGDFLNLVLESDLVHFLPNHSLNVIDKLSMANSVEIRVPYLDRFMVEFAAKLPLRFKMRGGVSKYLLRRLAEKLLPQNNDPAKRGGVTGPPLRRWLTFHLEDYVKSVLAPSRLKKSRIINADFAVGLVRNHYRLKNQPHYFENDNIDALFSDQTIKLWKLILFQVWWERYFS